MFGGASAPVVVAEDKKRRRSRRIMGMEIVEKWNDDYKDDLSLYDDWESDASSASVTL